MSKYSFTAHEKNAIFTIHGERCYMCNELIDLKTMQIDHIIPETLIGTKELASILTSFSLPQKFDLNSPSNWLPSCASCNRKKSSSIFTPSPLIQLMLERAKNKKEKVTELIKKTVSKRKATNALNVLEQLKEEDSLDEYKEDIYELFDLNLEMRVNSLKFKPFKLTSDYEIVNESNTSYIVKTRFGIGYQQKGDNLHSSYLCPNCGGVTAWNGSRCMKCGMISDD